MTGRGLFEPIDPVVPPPRGGWPACVFRVELVGDLSRLDAAYELACLSRRMRMGVVAGFGGFDMTAWPHQSADQIARGYLTARLLAAGAELAAVAVAREGARP